MSMLAFLLILIGLPFAVCLLLILIGMCLPLFGVTYIPDGDDP